MTEQTTGSRATGPEGPESHRLSAAGVRFIAQWEGFRGRLYNDPLGHCTIGYGHLVHRGNCNGSEPERFRHGITQADGLQLLGQDAARFEAGVNGAVRVRLTQPQFDALVSFAFNVGLGNFGSSTLLRRLNGGDYRAVPSELMRWTNNGLPGLVRRRRAEGVLFSEGRYQSAIAEDEELSDDGPLAEPDGVVVGVPAQRRESDIEEGPMTEQTTPDDAERVDDPALDREGGPGPDAPASDDEEALDYLRQAMAIAVEMGLSITSTTGGTHSPNSYHYSKPYRNVAVGGRTYQVGRAFDAGAPGNPDPLYRRFFLRVAQLRPPTELFYDPMGYYYKNGQRRPGAIGGHRDHVHVAY